MKDEKCERFTVRNVLTEREEDVIVIISVSCKNFVQEIILNVNC